MSKMSLIFNPHNKLGEGGYGIVCKGSWDGKTVAIKRIQLHQCCNQEEDAMKKLDHPNVVKFFHAESDDNFRYYCLELCDGTLDQMLSKDNDPEKFLKAHPMPIQLLNIYQLATGLEYIHKQGLIHRDLKPENVLIIKNRENQETMKWADFGLSKPVNERGTCSMSGMVGGIRTIRPIILAE
ncbi:cell division protein kinase 2 homolog [Daphnia pulicaria]|uniref:cell division protein kinase 2 homolog n=1 Tax=Daphnia pulicaria TaxID=35523 RepID=UPI001EEAC461|nr:cell division protein kinase 2 homolog [Daphnia pulicaria]